MELVEARVQILYSPPDSNLCVLDTKASAEPRRASWHDGVSMKLRGFGGEACREVLGTSVSRGHRGKRSPRKVKWDSMKEACGG